MVGQQHVTRPALQLVGNHHVVVAVAHHVHDAVLQRFDFFAQHLGLALLQAHCPRAVAAGQLHGRQQLRMALKKVGRVDQELGNVSLGDRG